MKTIDTILNYILGFFLSIPIIAVMCLPVVNLLVTIFVSAGYQQQKQKTLKEDVVLKIAWVLVVISNTVAIIYAIKNP